MSKMPEKSPDVWVQLYARLLSVSGKRTGHRRCLLTNGPISACCISPETWEAMVDEQEDNELGNVARARMKGQRFKVKLDEL